MRGSKMIKPIRHLSTFVVLMALSDVTLAQSVIDDLSSMSAGELLFDWLDNTLQPTLAGGIADFARLISPVMGSAVITWFVVWAVRYIREEQPITDLIWRFFVLSTVCFFAFSAPYYANTIVPMVNSIPTDLSSAFVSGGDGESLQNIADEITQSNRDTIDRVWGEASFASITGLDFDNLANVTFATVIIGGAGTVYVAIGILIMLVAKLMLNVTLALGPAFIAAAFFPATRTYFSLWVNQLVNYMILATLVAVVFSGQLALISDLTILTDDGTLPPDRVDKLAILYIISIATLVLIPPLASSLSGGMGLNGLVGNTAQTVMAMARPTAAVGRMLGNMGGNKGPSAMSGNSIKPNRPG